jgi:hypothetical protein
MGVRNQCKSKEEYLEELKRRLLKINNENKYLELEKNLFIESYGFCYLNNFLLKSRIYLISE